MRHIPAGIAGQLEARVTTLAHVWRIERRDGAVFAFTDHDTRLHFDDLWCEPAVGVAPGALEKNSGLQTDTTSISGVLSSDAIAEVDLAAGMWDGARVDLFLVNWRYASERVHLFRGSIGEVRRGAGAFEAELRGMQAALNVPVGRVFSRYCDADLGDTRCGVDREAPAFRGEGEIVALLGGGSFRAGGLSAFAAGWFERGALIWADGRQSEVLVHRLEGDVALIEIDGAVDAHVGASFTVFAGCDKRFATCRSKFTNTENFRGFPHMPGNDAVQTGPSASAPMDGKSRFE